ncbi:MAG: LPXTG cell wall anchor domain-containing protein, partial [Clostridia bacterium]|nr:LPXTG cell wall anchor domain-containing protein [Clostridia bacterium]
YLLSDETYYVTVSDGKASFEKNGSFIVNDAIPPAPTPWVPVIPMPTPTPTPTPGGDEIIDDEDVPLAGLPNTGDNGSGFLGITVTATVILAAGAVVLCRRRRTR